VRFGLALLSLCMLCTARAHADHPPDPFAAEYRVPEAREVGTTAGQLRIVGSGVVGVGRGGSELGLAGTLELLTFAYLGVRGTLETSVLPPDDGPFVMSARVGPSLHLLPYRRIDVALFFEAGAALLEPRTRHKTGMPVLAPGLGLDIWLASWATIRVEGHLDWGIYELRDEARSYLRFAGQCGLGFAL
jgi:hypothetical protein